MCMRSDTQRENCRITRVRRWEMERGQSGNEHARSKVGAGGFGRLEGNFLAWGWSVVCW